MDLAYTKTSEDPHFLRFTTNISDSISISKSFYFVQEK